MNIRIFFFFFLCVPFFSIAAEFCVETVSVPMRDGILLPTDIYLPSEKAKGLPCILIRTPAGRQQKVALAYVPLTRHGYAVAIQETRSFLDATGKTIPYRSDGWHELQDGYDAVEWLAKSPLTNGKIGTIGVSAQGITQLLMAPSAPPSLRCQYVGVAASSLRDHAVFPGGKLMKHQVEAWLGHYAADPGVFSFVSNQQFYDAFWDEFDTFKVADKVNVPAVLQGGWFDVFIQGTLDAFTSRQSKGGPGARGKQKLVVGPWTHFWPMITALGEFEVPAAGRQPPVDLSPVRWFDRYLKGEDNGADSVPPVTYYVMGPFDGTPSSGNVWKHAQEWPVPAVPTSFYLGDGKALVAEAAEVVAGSASFVHDPLNPVPTLGGHNLFISSGPMDQRPIEEREDVLVFSSKPLLEDLEVTGRVRVQLFVSSDCCDTDFIVRLTDVYPDGRSILIADGAFRTGLLSLLVSERDPNLIHEIEIDLASTSLVFAKGHRIRLSVSGSNFPRYDLNHNVGLLGKHANSCVVAHNEVYYGDYALSRVILPVVRQRTISSQTQ